MGEECCGSCAYFKNECFTGEGGCSLHGEETECGDYCGEWVMLVLSEEEEL